MSYSLVVEIEGSLEVFELKANISSKDDKQT
jgi:hypothetical protein